MRGKAQRTVLRASAEDGEKMGKKAAAAAAASLLLLLLLLLTWLDDSARSMDARQSRLHRPWPSSTGHVLQSRAPARPAAPDAL